MQSIIAYSGVLLVCYDIVLKCGHIKSCNVILFYFGMLLSCHIMLPISLEVVLQMLSYLCVQGAFI